MSNTSYDPATDPLHPYMFALVKNIPIEPHHVATRCHNVMRNDNIHYIGDLVRKTEAEMLRTPNFSRVSLYALKYGLSRLGLRLGMDIPWPPSQERIKEACAKCVELGLWDFDNFVAQQVNVRDAAYDETMDALQGLERELKLVKTRLIRLRNDVVGKRAARAALAVDQ